MYEGEVAIVAIVEDPFGAIEPGSLRSGTNSPSFNANI